MISEYIEKVKSVYTEHKEDLYVALLIFLVSIASFGLGRLSILWPKKEPITITQNAELQIQNNKIGNTSSKTANLSSGIQNSALGKYVASKSGKFYHYPWCAGAQRIKEENKIWFQTKEGAEKAGYKPAGNCEGL